MARRSGAWPSCAALLQSAVFSSIEVLGGSPDLLLVTLLGIALLRGAITGAVAGFIGGLVLDIANMGTLGVSSLLLTLAGYWTGRYGETTGRDRFHAPILSVLVLTVLVTVGGYALHFMLGEDVSAQARALRHAAPDAGPQPAHRRAGVRALPRAPRPRTPAVAAPEVRLLG